MHHVFFDTSSTLADQISLPGKVVWQECQDQPSLKWQRIGGRRYRQWALGLTSFQDHHGGQHGRSMKRIRSDKTCPQHRLKNRSFFWNKGSSRINFFVLNLPAGTSRLSFLDFLDWATFNPASRVTNSLCTLRAISPKAAAWTVHWSRPAKAKITKTVMDCFIFGLFFVAFGKKGLRSALFVVLEYLEDDCPMPQSSGFRSSNQQTLHSSMS